MGSTPIKRARFALLDDLGIDEVVDLYIEHGTVRELVRHLFTPRHEGETPSVRFLYDWLQDDAERWTEWQRAKRIIGTLEADAAVQAARDATPKDVQVRRLQADVHKWRASVLNREEFGDRPSQVNIVTSADLWLEAMMKAVPPSQVDESDEPPLLTAGDDES